MPNKLSEFWILISVAPVYNADDLQCNYVHAPKNNANLTNI